jgi:hypothetical protein
MISPAVDEVVATGQFLLRARREGRPFWRTFWHGGEAEPTPAPPLPGDQQPLTHQLAGGMELRAIPWNLALCAAVGVWLMVAPAVFGNTGVAAANGTLVGALVVTFAVIGFGEASRSARLVNVLFGLWLLVSPLVLWDDTSDVRWPESVAGLAVVLLSLRRGPVDERFGTWDRYVV